MPGGGNNTVDVPIMVSVPGTIPVPLTANSPGPTPTTLTPVILAPVPNQVPASIVNAVTWIDASKALPPYGLRILFIAAVGTPMSIGIRKSTDAAGDHYATDGSSFSYNGILFWAALPTPPI